MPENYLSTRVLDSYIPATISDSNSPVECEYNHPPSEYRLGCSHTSICVSIVINVSFLDIFHR